MKDGGTAAIIVAAGSGERMGLERSKPFLPLGGKPILAHAIEKFEECSAVEEIILVARREDKEAAGAMISDYRFQKVSTLAEGGAQRQDSVYEGLRALGSRRIRYVLVHDGVRPFVSVEKIHRLLAACQEYGAAILAVPLKDTIKRSNAVPFVEETLDRTKLWAAQTPQGFTIDILTRAYEQARRDHFVATDDAGLVEHLGVRVKIIEGEYENIKITTPDDLQLAEHILHREGPIRGG
jgi:2-C-methyl-D-erythritol 4-phosphate cytidylyltransferase